MNTWKNALMNMHLKTKIFLILFCALLVGTGVVFGAFQMPYRAYDKQLYEGSVQTMALFSQMVQAELDGITELSFRMLSDNSMQKYLAMMKDQPKNTVRWLEAKREVSDRMNFFAYWKSGIISLRVVSSQGVQFYHGFSDAAITREVLSGMLALAAERNGSAVWQVLPGENGASLVLARQIRRAEDLRLDGLGTILIHVNLSAIVNNCLREMQLRGVPMQTAIHDGTQYLYRSAPDLEGQVQAPDGYQRVRENGRDVLCVRFTAENGWRYINEVDYRDIHQRIYSSNIRALTISLFGIVAACLVCILLLQSILRHLKVLLEKYDMFARGQEPPEAWSIPYRNRHDEIGKLHRHFDRMMREYQKAIKSDYENRLLLQEKQMHQLRAQVKPHFLLNTLESIYCLAKGLEDDRIAVMTGALGRMLRSSLRDKRDVISVAEDWRIVVDYLRIQHLRYGERLEVDCALPEEVLGVAIPSMTLQPLVENSIHHAADEMLNTCHIRVTAQMTETQWQVMVSDNGPGMDEDILKQLENNPLPSESIGLLNIQHRLQYLFGAEYGLTIQNQEGITSVVIHLPKEGTGLC